ncbi:ABC transporter permease [candidate division KSB1 bacterium]
MNRHKPPYLAEKLIWILTRPGNRSTLMGDVEEEYNLLINEKSKFKADLWCYLQILKPLVLFIIGNILWSFTMFKNYVKIAFRNVKRQKGFSFINIFGLAVGMACCILILLWLQDEYNYDRFHENADDLYRIITERNEGDRTMLLPRAPYPLGDVLVSDFPEIIDYSRYTGGYTGWNLKYKDKSYNSERIAFADPSFFKMFTFPFLIGDPKTALEERYSVILTERLAKKCFGDEDPIGKIMQMSDTDIIVAGVIKDVPRNSHMQFDYIIPIINQTKWREQDFTSWEQGESMYIQLRENTSGKDVGKKIEKIIGKYHPKSESTYIKLQSLKKVHLFSNFDWDGQNAGKGNITFVYLFTIIVVFILLIACINFMNLSTARYGNRAKEIGMRKVVGADRKSIIFQFFNESILFSMFALIIAMIFAFLLLPEFNNLSGKQLSLDFFDNLQIFVGIILLTLLTGFIAGSYPALFLSSFKPVLILKNMAAKNAGRRSLFRKILVVFQFSIATLLIAGTLIIYSQISFINNKPLGYDKDNIVFFAGYGKFGDNYETARNELLQNPFVLNVTKSFPPSRSSRAISDFEWEGKDPNAKVMLVPSGVSYNFIETFNMEMVEGRSFSREFADDPKNCIVNETAVKVMGLTDPVGKRIKYSGQQGYIYGFDNEEGKIIGVVKDFHNNSLHNKIQPTVLKYTNRGFFVCVKIDPNNVSEALSFLESKWKEFVPGRPYRFNFLSESIDDYYGTERKLMTIFGYFTFLSIFIASLGLLGLSAYMAEKRTKEIGIRKILGASGFSVIKLLSKEFIVLIITANVIAWPIAYYFGNIWLKNYAYRINQDIGLFILAGLFGMLIVLLSIIYQSIKAANADPVDSLRYE